jgi:tetratricopeptide (TPR) repeat protein
MWLGMVAISTSSRAFGSAVEAITLPALAMLISSASLAQERCEPAAARVVSVQGTVELQRAGAAVWMAATLDEALCLGDAIRVGRASRAALVLANDALLRLDQRTTLAFRSIIEERRSLLDLIFGAVYFFSHQPRALAVDTPFVNAAAEGTEFLVRVADDRAEVIMLDGQVLLQNAEGELRVARGDAAIVLAGAAPAPMIVARPRDAVAWALYYPPVLAALAERRARPRPLPPGLQAAVDAVAANDYAGALDALDAVPETARDARYWTYRAGVLLNVGRVDEARAAIARALALDPEAGEALAQGAIIAIVQNRTADALADARRAVELSPDSGAAAVALSYALQANFRLEEAREALRAGAERAPEDALVFARLSEIEQSLGALGAARDAAEQAVALAPDLGRTQMVLGFAALTRIDIDQAKAAFERAIALDSAEPLARLGLGLAIIRSGALERGRKEIEIAAALDPNDSLIRSYLGKAYFEERRDPLDAEQYAIAKQLDPNDPTPWFYDAIRLQTVNRPVEALRNIERSIALNDNRAVYRSRLLLDEDLAVRQVSLARIYNNLGFEQLGLNEATKSLSLDPANYSAHRFLADTYAGIPRYEIARASELLQSQLLQPININPVAPSLPIADLNVVTGVGPAAAAFNEFTPLFQRNQVQLTGTGLVGNKQTAAGEAIASGIYNRFSLSTGGFSSGTDGFRPNADVDNTLYDLFSQFALNPKLSVQAEYRYRETEQGDLQMNFDPDFFTTDRRRINQDSARLGLTFTPSPGSTLLVSGIYTDRKEQLFLGEPVFAEKGKIKSINDGYQLEGLYIFDTPSLNLQAGGGTYEVDVDINNSNLFFEVDDQRVFFELSDRHFDRKQDNIYSYFRLNFIESVTITTGLSYDTYDEGAFNRDSLNPKLGLRWNLSPNIAVRAAAFKTLKRALVVDQTVEPTEVAGFNQFFDEFNGTETWFYGIGLDTRLTDTLYGGAQLSFRDMNVPLGIPVDTTEDQDETRFGLYLYWTIYDDWAMTTGLWYDEFDRAKESIDDRPTRIRTLSVPVALSYFNPLGLFATIGTTYVHQNADRFPGPPACDEACSDGTDDFFLLDASVGYRFPGRHGIFSLEGTNLLDEKFNYQDDDFRTAGARARFGPFIPERAVLARLTLNF